MPLRYTHCAICDRPVARYKGPLQAFCSRKCYSTFWRMVKVCIRDKELRDKVIAKALELTSIAA